LHIIPATSIQSDTLKNLFLEFPLNFLALLIGARLAVKIEKSTKIKLGLFQKLNFANMNL
jgi:hypothetical protein